MGDGANPINLQVLSQEVNRRAVGTVSVQPIDINNVGLAPTVARTIYIAVNHRPFGAALPPLDNAGLQLLEAARFILNNYQNRFTPLALLSQADRDHVLSRTSPDTNPFAGGFVAYTLGPYPATPPDGFIPAIMFSFAHGGAVPPGGIFTFQSAGVLVFQSPAIIRLDRDDINEVLFHEGIHVQDWFAIQDPTLVPADRVEAAGLMREAFLLVHDSPLAGLFTREGLESGAHQAANLITEVDAHSATAIRIFSGGNGSHRQLVSELVALLRYWNRLLIALRSGFRAPTTTPARSAVAATLMGNTRAGLIRFMQRVYDAIPNDLAPIKSPDHIDVRPTAPAALNRPDPNRLRRPRTEP